MVSALSGAPRNIRRMAEYKIILDGLSGFGVEVTSANPHQSVRGFATETDTRNWIAEHQAAAETRILETALSTAAREQMRYRLYQVESRPMFGLPKHS